ncbi:MAG: major facilitator superfamily MFS_1 [Ferroplasma sp. Type II]|jgi:MFS family permease|uniref:MFS transporter n=1 Tax=Ferroplasma sp. Type II TaxID=261388 RepID=UPI0003894A85|nr:MFS transporter [Ferroplasma sp. Type II]EQB74548.1 MAG: major facilitator superfamily MFS_1 [Ferroplasma sp. Type II]
MDNVKKLIPYWFFVFTIGFGWFILAPVIPELMAHLSATLSEIVLILSVYGYTMAIIGLLAGVLSAKFTVKSSIYLAMAFSTAGLLVRIFATGYSEFLVLSIVAASAYPFSLAPVGSIAESMDPKKSATITGLSIGFLFLGMSSGALIGPYIYLAFSLTGIMALPAILTILASIWLFIYLPQYPEKYKGKSLRGSFKPGMIKNWYIGMAMASISILFGDIAATALGFHFTGNFLLKLSGLMGGVEFLGSALGALILPFIFERYHFIRLGTVLTALVSFVFAIILLYSLVYTSFAVLITGSFFIFGFFGNAFWVLALNSIINYVEDPGRAGFATSMYSVATNVGVAIIPVLISAEFVSISRSIYGIIPALLIVLVSFLLSPLILSKGRQATVASPEAD